MTLLFAFSTVPLRRVALPPRTLGCIGSLQWNSVPGNMRWKATTAEKKKSKEDKPSKDDMTRTQLANSVASLYDLPKVKSQRILKTVFDAIVEALSDGKTVKISSFGTFQKYMAKGRTLKNIQTKETVEVPSKNRVRFRAYKSLKEVVEASKPGPSPKTRTTPTP